MKEAFELASAIIIGLGGGGAIVFKFSEWLGNIWASRMFENERAKHEKDIEQLKLEINKELERINAINDKALHISKSQYDNEYRIYQEIWGRMYECILLSKNLYPIHENKLTDPEKEEERKMEKYSKYVDAFNEYSKTIDKYAPFYREDFYDIFINIRRICSDVGSLFKMNEFEVKYSETFALCRDEYISPEERRWVYIDFPKEVEEIRTKLQKDIREYLLSLQLIE